VRNFVRKLILGPSMPRLDESKVGLSYEAVCLQHVWNTSSVGFIRILRLLMSVSVFAFPTVYIVHFLRHRSSNVLYVSSDFYVALRVFALILMLWVKPGRDIWVTIGTLYMMADMSLYLCRIVFLADIYGSTLSSVRSVFFVLINYFESLLGFAILYRQWGGLSIAGPLCPTQALYFSFVTGTTLGYGDIHAVSSFAQELVMAQLILSISFLSMFIGAFVSRLGSDIPDC
jgi:hypothetical protein